MKLFIKFICLSCLFLGWSCNNELDIIEEGFDIPVVYGFIDLSDSTQYVRIERAVGKEGTSAFELAKDVNLIYYENLNVELYVPKYNQRYTLESVDGNVDGYQREEGPFGTSPNILYKIPSDVLGLRGEEEVQLIIERGEPLTTVRSVTNVMRPIELIDFDKKEVSWFGNSKLTLRWSATKNSGIFDVYFLVRYSEKQGVSGEWEDKSLLWKRVQNRPYNSKEKLYQKEKFVGRELYRFLESELSAEQDVFRRFEDFDVIIKGGAKELIEYRRIILANAGLTGAEELPNYTNIDGGLGIFSSKYTVISENHFLNRSSTDSLIRNLSDLNFVK